MTHSTFMHTLLLAAGAICSACGAAFAGPTPVALIRIATSHVENVPDDETIVSPALDGALKAICSKSENPGELRQAILNKLMLSNRCYSRQMSQEQWEHAIQNLDMLPPGMFTIGGQRYFSSGTIWIGNGTVGSASGRAQRVNLTFSFPADGVSWDGAVNNLDARIGAQFGAANKDRGRELIRQGLTGWRRWAGITYTEVADDNVGFTTSTTHSVLRGDIRIGGRSVDGTFGILAYNQFPQSGGDMVLDTDEFVGGSFAGTGNNYRAYRNTIAHEHGHGTGYIHTVPCNSTKLMEPSLATAFDLLQVDEIRGAQRNYGDRFAGNNSAANAKDFGNLTAPALRSVIEKNLSTNGTTGFNNSDEDWFRFTIDSTQNVTISADPTGGTYVNGQQSGGCDGSTSSIVADQAGNLNLELRSSDGTSVILTSTAGAAGVTETINAMGLTAGTYTLRVSDSGPNANQIVQLYDLTVRVGTAKAPPTAIAGINKRVLAGTLCYFMGNINSYVNDAGSSIASYSWDLDGDGTFEVANTAQPTRNYSNNGTVTVTLRVTDNFGMTSTDSIQVVVFGATCPITITQQPQPVARCTGQSATFTTGATSAGTVSYQWRRNNANVPGAMSPSLIIDPVMIENAGNYDCVITSSCGGSTTTNVAALTVTQSVAITTQPQSATVAQGDSTIFGVAASGTGPFTYVWRRNGTPVPGGNQSALLITNAQPAHEGDYTVDVSNACGGVTSNVATLTVEVACSCDWNQDSTLNSQDYFDFLTAFFNNNSDINMDGVTNSQDFFDFLTCFFAGCK